MKYIIDALENKSLMIEPVDNCIKLTIDKETVSIPYMASCDLTKIIKDYQEGIANYAFALASCYI